MAKRRGINPEAMQRLRDEMGKPPSRLKNRGKQSDTGSQLRPTAFRTLRDDVFRKTTSRNSPFKRAYTDAQREQASRDIDALGGGSSRADTPMFTDALANARREAAREQREIEREQDEYEGYLVGEREREAQEAAEAAAGTETEEGADGWTLWNTDFASTRVSAFRYNFPNEEIEVNWVNGKNNGYIYSGVPEDVFSSFREASSKGMFVNDVLNGYR